MAWERETDRVLRDTTLSLIWVLDASPHEAAPVSLRAMRAGLLAVAERYEIVLVTQEPDGAMRHFTEADPSLRVVVPERGGDGAALTAGCAAATGDYLAFAVGDDAPEWDALPALMPYLRQSDVVSGFHVAPEPPARDDALRAIALGFLYGVSLRDPFSATAIFRAELLRSTVFAARGSLLRVEALAQAQAQGAAITEVALPERTVAGGQVSVERDERAALQLRAREGADPARNARYPVFDYGDAARLWWHLRRSRPLWIVREMRPALRPPSEYVMGGVALALGAWLVRNRLGRWVRK